MNTPTATRKVKFRLTRERYSKLLLDLSNNKEAWRELIVNDRTAAAQNYADDHGISVRQAYNLFSSAGIYTPQTRRRKPAEPPQEPFFPHTPLDALSEVLARLTRIEATLGVLCREWHVAVPE